MSARRTGQVVEHPLDLLPDFSAGRLDGEETAAIREHVNHCRGCAVEVAAWQAVAEAATAVAAEASTASPDLIGRITESIRAEPDAGRDWRRQLRWLMDLTAAQVPVVRREIWPASAIVLVLGGAIAWLEPTRTVPGAALSLFAPLAAAIGVGLLYGRENDPSLELARATPTSPRVVLLARLVLILTFDLGLAIGSSVILLAVPGPRQLEPLISLWLGPMVLLANITLLLSLVLRPTVAIALAVAVWSIRVVELLDPRVIDAGALGWLMDGLWQTSWATFALAGVALGLALLFVTRADTFGGLETS